MIRTALETSSKWKSAAPRKKKMLLLIAETLNFRRLWIEVPVGHEKVEDAVVVKVTKKGGPAQVGDGDFPQPGFNEISSKSKFPKFRNKG